MLAIIQSRTFCLFCLLSKHVKIIICKAITLPVVQCGCDTWLLMLRKDHRLRVYNNRVLRSIFGLRRCEVKRGWRKICNEESHDL
jgi:hypothetical protein